MAEPTHDEATLQTAKQAILIAVETAATRVIQCEALEAERGERWANCARELSYAYSNIADDDE